MRPILTLTLAAALAACTTTANHHVRVDQDPAVDLAAYKTFGFEPAPGIGYSSIAARRFEHAAREQLEAHGYVYQPQDPDLRVSWLLKIADRQELRSAPSGPAWRGLGSVETVNYRQGTLRIDLVDTHRRAAVWQGVAEGRVDPKAEQQPGASVEAAVREILANLPATK